MIADAYVRMENGSLIEDGADGSVAVPRYMVERYDELILKKANLALRQEQLANADAVELDNIVRHVETRTTLFWWDEAARIGDQLDDLTAAIRRGEYPSVAEIQGITSAIDFAAEKTKEAGLRADSVGTDRLPGASREVMASLVENEVNLRTKQIENLLALRALRRGEIENFTEEQARALDVHYADQLTGQKAAISEFIAATAQVQLERAMDAVILTHVEQAIGLSQAAITGAISMARAAATLQAVAAAPELAEEIGARDLADKLKEVNASLEDMGSQQVAIFRNITQAELGYWRARAEAESK